MGYIDRAQENARVAAKAAAFDKQQQQMREQDMYNRGANDISAEVERQIRLRNSGYNNPSINYNQPSQLGLATTLTGI